MLEPQSTVLFVLLIVAFGALMWWMLVARHLALRILAASLAFIPAMTFGIAVVNKYYDYYQSWGAAISDLTNQGAPSTTVSATGNGLATGLSALTSHHLNTGLARQLGFTLRVPVPGPISGITRLVYIFLPPQYFWPSYQKYRFPVIELLHGFPGQPQDWITVLGVNQILDSLVSEHRADPAVLVIPDANGGRGVSLQCLNQASGPQDDTYLAEDLPTYIAQHLQVQPPGLGWGVAGYSEGGFCAANLGLQHGREYSYAGVLSGYFQPSDNQLANPPRRRVGPFGGNRRQAELNNPMDLARSLPIGRPVPQFWLGAGMQAPADVQAAQVFGQLLQLRQPAVTLKLVPGTHTMPTWRTLLQPMLSWMSRGLAHQVAMYNSPTARARRAAFAAAAAKARLLGQRPHGQPSGKSAGSTQAGLSPGGQHQGQHRRHPGVAEQLRGHRHRPARVHPVIY